MTGRSLPLSLACLAFNALAMTLAVHGLSLLAVFPLALSVLSLILLLTSDDFPF